MLALQGHPSPSCLPPLPEGGVTFEVEFPEVEPADEDDSVPSATTSPDEEVEETEQDDEEEHPPKRRRQDKAKSAGSPSKKMALEDDGDSGSSSPSVKDPMEVVPLNTAPPAGSAVEFDGLFDEDALGSDEDEEPR